MLHDPRRPHRYGPSVDPSAGVVDAVAGRSQEDAQSRSFFVHAVEVGAQSCPRGRFEVVRMCGQCALDPAEEHVAVTLDQGCGECVPTGEVIVDDRTTDARSRRHPIGAERGRALGGKESRGRDEDLLAAVAPDHPGSSDRAATRRDAPTHPAAVPEHRRAFMPDARGSPTRRETEFPLREQREPGRDRASHGWRSRRDADRRAARTEDSPPVDPRPRLSDALPLEVSAW